MFGLQRLLYGPLRPIEIEQLYEKAWFAITETCLAMTIFREEVGGWFLVMFVALLVGKVWGWIGEGRVEVLEQQPPANPRLFHARLSFSLFLSLAFDISILNYAVKTVLQMARPNMMVMFAFEFAVLTISSTSTAARYAISLTEALIIKRQTQLRLEERRAELRVAREEALQRAAAETDTASQQSPAQTSTDLPDPDSVGEIDVDVPGWDEKGQWVFYLDLVTGKNWFLYTPMLVCIVDRFAQRVRLLEAS
jgi:E3 ubiquitin-protein ligase synoviolin